MSMTYETAQTEYFTGLIAPEILPKLPLYETFCELLEMCKSTYYDTPAISDMVHTITYGELYDRAACRRQFLYEQGFKKGDIIAVLAPNSMYSMELYMAIPTAGCTLIMIPAAEHAVDRECLASLIRKFDIKGLFINPEYREVAEGQATKVFDIHDTATTPGPMAEVSGEDIAVICFSVNDDPANPYGAMLSHRAIMRAAHNGLFIPGRTYGQTTVAILPLSHVFGAIRGLLTCIYTGALVYACEDMSNIVFDIPKMKPTILTLVPGLAEMILAVAKIKGPEFLDGIETIICGGAYCQPKLVRQAAQYGIKLLVGYGMTEAANIVSGNCDTDTVPDSIGKVYPGTEVRIVDGEIQVKGDVVMSGYYKDPERTAEVLSADGWLSTGDLGEFDENGFLHITGLRKNLIILPNGENISPDDLRREYGKLEGIADCRIYEDSLRGRPIMTIEIVPELSYYEAALAEAGLALEGIHNEGAGLSGELSPEVTKLIEKDLKARVKAFAETSLPSYKVVTKTVVTAQAIDHGSKDRYYTIEY